MEEDPLPAQMYFEGDSDGDGALSNHDSRFLIMDTYVWGALKEDATEGVVALHGVSPGISRI